MTQKQDGARSTPQSLSRRDPNSGKGRGISYNMMDARYVTRVRMWRMKKMTASSRRRRCLPFWAASPSRAHQIRHPSPKLHQWWEETSGTATPHVRQTMTPSSNVMNDPLAVVQHRMMPDIVMNHNRESRECHTLPQADNQAGTLALSMTLANHMATAACVTRLAINTRVFGQMETLMNTLTKDITK